MGLLTAQMLLVDSEMATSGRRAVASSQGQQRLLSAPLWRTQNFYLRILKLMIKPISLCLLQFALSNAQDNPGHLDQEHP